VHRFMILAIVLAMAITAVVAEEKPTDTPKAARSRKKLKEKTSYECTELALRDVLPELTEKIGVPLRIEPRSGVSANIKVTYKGDDQPLEKMLAEMFKKNGLGYYVLSDAKSAEDGSIYISSRSTERGYRAEEESQKASTGSKNKSDEGKTASKSKTKGKDKTEAKEKKSGKEKTESPADEGDKAEQDSARKLNFAKTLLDDGKTARAKARLEDIVEKYPKSKAAEEARELLKKLDK